jgi:hypothetical protein
LVDAEADRGEDPVAVFADRFAELDKWGSSGIDVGTVTAGFRV